MPSEQNTDRDAPEKPIEKDWRVYLIIGLIAIVNPGFIKFLAKHSEYSLLTLILHYIDNFFRIIGVIWALYAGYLKLKKIKEIGRAHV